MTSNKTKQNNMNLVESIARGSNVDNQNIIHSKIRIMRVSIVVTVEGGLFFRRWHGAYFVTITIWYMIYISLRLFKDYLLYNCILVFLI